MCDMERSEKLTSALKGQLKLIDFGIATAIQNDTTNIVRENAIGTVNYISPEALTCSGNAPAKMGRSSDIWSLGCILYQMAYGRPPFSGLNIMQKVRFVPDPNYAIKYPPLPKFGNASHLIDVLKRCLVRDPKERATIPELLNHPFLCPSDT